ncbi:hypothetical protein HPB49_014706 [Dermacentor silvarum]|uniref:Uncharacterized protein n=1 Tax=Dermacentor silvarum TaxID=543639 RepID=A0ACB8C476_DERSI|nr:hypothetical protein HPB49_014706 [Dermacentor silvarum]
MRQWTQPAKSFAELQAVKGQLRSATQPLRRCQMKLAKMTTVASRQKRLDQEILKLSAREKLILDQCLMKANAKTATAVRNKKEWLYDCLLLKVKSTAVYTFLQENGFLPLPNPRTLYGYLKSLKADFGFDASLREKLQGIPEREHRATPKPRGLSLPLLGFTRDLLEAASLEKDRALQDSGLEGVVGRRRLRCGQEITDLEGDVTRWGSKQVGVAGLLRGYVRGLEAGLHLKEPVVRMLVAAQWRLGKVVHHRGKKSSSDAELTGRGAFGMW